jgi:hypothetical protein
MVLDLSMSLFQTDKQDGADSWRVYSILRTGFTRTNLKLQEAGDGAQIEVT